MVGETPGDFVKRLRLEKSLHQMCFGKRTSLTEIALESGFSSASDFSRSFKQRYGTAPSKFDAAAWRSQHASRLEPNNDTTPFKLTQSPPRSNPDQFRVRIRELPARRVAYIRVSNPYVGNAVFAAAGRLVAWAEERECVDGQWLGYQFENPELTALEDCRYNVAVELDRNLDAEGEVGIFYFPPMLVAEVAMKGDLFLELRLLQWLYGSWLPRSKYVPADHPCFEVWKGRPFADGIESFELRIHLPIRS